MQRKTLARIVSRPLAILTAGLVLVGSALAAGPQETVLYAFQGGNDALQPVGALVAGPGGVLYGATAQGGANYCPSSGLHCGAVFQLAPPATTGGAWTESVLYSFTGRSDGWEPQAGVILDKAGNLYGTTTDGNAFSCNTSSCGTAFELTRPITPGGTWTETTLHTFTGYAGNDGAIPEAGLTFDKTGNLYGTTFTGGRAAFGWGTVFELTRPITPGGAWTESVLYDFPNINNGDRPMAGVVFDKAGNLYGTASQSSIPYFGTVFKLSPPGTKGGAWTETTLYRFTGTTGSTPRAGLTFDAKGNLYGTTAGGGPGGTVGADGTVFELSPPATKGGAWTETVLYSFKGLTTGNTDGSGPEGSVIFDKAGNLYSTTAVGGSTNCPNGAGLGCGTIFKLTPPATTGGVWTETVLHRFTGGHDGALPSGGVLFGPGGALYGATAGGGDPACSSYHTGCGTVFSVAP